jgi:hypothetical protein
VVSAADNCCGAELGQTTADSEADTASAAGDNCDLSIEGQLFDCRFGHLLESPAAIVAGEKG